MGNAGENGFPEPMQIAGRLENGCRWFYWIIPFNRRRNLIGAEWRRVACACFPLGSYPWKNPLVPNAVRYKQNAKITITAVKTAITDPSRRSLFARLAVFQDFMCNGCTRFAQLLAEDRVRFSDGPIPLNATFPASCWSVGHHGIVKLNALPTPGRGEIKFPTFLTISEVRLSATAFWKAKCNSSVLIN